MSIAEVYGYVVGVIGISPEYFLDEMSQYEVMAVLKARNEDSELTERLSWERMRLQSFFTVAAFAGKPSRPTELIRFPWDTKDKVEREILSEADFMKEAELVKQRLNIE